MDFVIKSIPNVKRDMSEKERDVVNSALIYYQIVLGQYEKYTDEMKQKDLEKLSKEQNKTELDKMNPFDVDISEGKSYEPTLEDTKIFVYSSWAEAVANVKTPRICSGTKRKGIKRQVFRDVQNGKYVNRKVREIMNGFIEKLYNGQEKENENK